MTPEAKARQTIDTLLAQAGWHICNVADANIHAARGVAIREFPLNPCPAARKAVGTMLCLWGAEKGKFTLVRV